MANDQSMVESELNPPDALSKPMECEHAQPRKSKKQLRHNKTRRGGQKHKAKGKLKFSLLGNNTAGIKAKKDSLEALVELLGKPSCITLQETKLGSKDTFKLNHYQVFQRNRNGFGGGLVTAVDPNLNPMLVTSNNDEAEVLTVQIEVNNQKIRVINGYGPQDDDNSQNKLNF